MFGRAIVYLFDSRDCVHGCTQGLRVGTIRTAVAVAKRQSARKGGSRLELINVGRSFGFVSEQENQVYTVFVCWLLGA